VDISQKLIEIAKENNQELSSWVDFLRVDPLAEKLPFEDNSFDVVFSIAVFHHFPTKKYRLRMAKELYRVLRPGGKLVVSVWNLWQKRFWRYHLRFDLKNKLDWGDIYVTFKDNKGNVFQRYHHAYTKRELKKLLTESGFQVSSCRKNYNIICVALKK
jgi:SAM-dependent methyltransferase